MSARTEPVRAFLENPIFLSAVSSWFVAQLLKMVIVMLRGRGRGYKRSRRELAEIVAWRTGGMPSSHAALVSSIATSAAFLEGINSNLFVVSLFLAFIFMRDAMGVRRSSGVQAKTLNIIGRQLAEKWGIDYHPIKEVHGHTPLEVVIGMFLGIFIAAAYAYL
ncbi:MAG: divergent PAP2 family protein [Treponema sp.]|nr:divergent PAP2 family protein [Treponema sp.]